MDSPYNLPTQLSAIIHFLQRLDIQMVDAILDDSRTYQNFQKPHFIYRLGAALDTFIENGDTFLNVTKGSCGEGGCNFKCKGVSLTGNKTNNYLDLVIEEKDGIVIDMYECGAFKCDSKNFDKKERIYIIKYGAE